MKTGILLAAIGLMMGSMSDARALPKNSMNTFATFDERAQKGEPLTVVFYGGSLTWGAQATDPQRTSYRALVSRWLADKYPKARFEIWDSAIGGIGSQLGAFRLDRDVLAHKPDLVFLDFTINDGPYVIPPDQDRLTSYESVVRRLVQADVLVEQVILPAKQDVLPNPGARPLDPKHKEIAQAYGLPSADAVALVKSRVAEGKATPDQLWDAAPDTTHPGDAGYALYAEAAWQTFQQAIEQKAQCRIPEKMLYADTYMTVNRFKLATLKKHPQGWTVGQPTRSAVAYDFTPSRWMETVTIASRSKDDAQPPEPLVLKVQGSNLMFFGEATSNSGKYRVLVDGKEVKADDLGGIGQHGNWRYVEMLVQNLDASVPHRVEIIPELQPGQEFRMESLCVAGAPASVEAY